MKTTRTTFFILIGLAVVTLAVYWQVRGFEFIEFDDNIYVFENENVQKGFTVDNLKWAFIPASGKNQVYWHPLTWLSLMTDIELFGLNPGAFHLMNLAFHIINVLLLFLSLHFMTGAAWPSAFAAALFALHPINVDSVAWVAERKNLISTTFWMLTMLAYLFYARKPGIARYLLVCFTLALGLLSKPMLMTLPCLLLLLDFWPLGRIRLGQTLPSNIMQQDSQPIFQTSNIIRLVMEKIPLFVLCFLVLWVLAYSLHLNRQLVDLASSPMSLRIENAIVSYAAYLYKLIWPTNLAIFYPYPKTIPFWKTIAAAFLLFSISLPVVFRLKKDPYLTVGWFWYLGTLVPAIGLIQGGLWPALADRWAYVPAIGIFIMIAWGGPSFFKLARLNPKQLLVTAAGILCVLGIVSFKQAGHWKNNLTLFQHALLVTSENYVAHVNLGIHYAEAGQTEEAISHFRQAIRIQPDFALAHYNLGNALFRKGQLIEAEKAYKHIIRLWPKHAAAHYNLGNTYKELSRPEEAIRHYRQAIGIEPGHAKAHYNLAILLADREQVAEAIAHYQKSIAVKPDYGDAHLNLALLLSKANRHGEALGHYQTALSLMPGNAHIHYNLANAFNAAGKTDQAIVHLRKAIEMEPGHEKAHNNLATALLGRGRAAEAIPHYIKAIEINPDYASAHYNLGIAYFNTGDMSGAAASFKEALRLNPGAAHIEAAIDQAMTKMNP